MYCTCAPELRPNSALKLLVMTLTSRMEEKLSGVLLLEPVPAVEMSVAVMLSMVMLLARTRLPLATKLPELNPPGAGTMPGSVVASGSGLRLTGISCTSLTSKASWTWAFCVSSGLAASVTTTCSVTCPTSSFRFSDAISALRTDTAAEVWRKPSARTVTV